LTVKADDIGYLLEEINESTIEMEGNHMLDF